MSTKRRGIRLLLLFSMLLVACGPSGEDSIETETAVAEFETETEEQIEIEYFPDAVEVTRFKDISNFEAAFVPQDVATIHFDDVTLSVDEFTLKSMESYQGVIEKLTREHHAVKELTGAITIYFSDFVARYTPTFTKGEYCIGISLTIEARTEQCTGFYMECPDKNWGINDVFRLYTAYPNDRSLFEYIEYEDGPYEYMYDIDSARLEGEGIVGLWNGSDGRRQYVLYNDNTGVILPRNVWDLSLKTVTYEEISDGYYAVYDGNAEEVERLILDEDYLYEEYEGCYYVRAVWKEDYSDPVAWEIINVMPVENGDNYDAVDYEMTDLEKRALEIKADANSQVTLSQDYLRGQWFMGGMDYLVNGMASGFSPIIGGEKIWYDQNTPNSYLGFTNDQFVFSYEALDLYATGNGPGGTAKVTHAVKISGVYHILEEGTYEDSQNVSCKVEFVVTSVSPEYGCFESPVYEGLREVIGQSVTTELGHIWYMGDSNLDTCKALEEAYDMDFPEEKLEYATGTIGYRPDGSYGYYEYDEPHPFYAINYSQFQFSQESNFFSDETYMKVRSRIFGFDDMEPGKYLDDLVEEKEQ